VLLAGLVLPEAIYDLFLHCVYVKALTDVAMHARGTWDHTVPAEFVGTRSWRQRWTRIAAPVYAGVLLAAVVGLALACVAIGVAWPVISGLVLGGAALAALRLSGLDPFAFHLGTGEPARAKHSVQALSPQGFGGLSVPVDALATLGGEGTLHCLSGGAGLRNPRATLSASARLSRQATTAWLTESRRTQHGGGLILG
jgi:hypothetical protein